MKHHIPQSVGNLQDIMPLLPILYSEHSAKTLGFALKRAETLTGRRLSQIDADVKAWRALAGSIVWAGAFRGDTPGDQQHAFDEWVKKVDRIIRRAQTHVALPVVPTGAEAAWDRIEAYVREVENTFDSEGRRLLPNLSSLSIATLAARCRGTHPATLDTAAAAGAFTRLPSNMADQFRNSVAFWNNLLAQCDRHPALAGLLPEAPIGELPRLRDRPLDWTQFSAEFISGRDAAIRIAIRGERETRRDRFGGRLGRDPHADRRAARRGRRKPVRNTTASQKTHLAALSWLVRHAFPDREEAYALHSFQDVFAPETIERACRTYVERARASEALKNPDETSSGGSILSRLETLARRNGYPEEVLWALDDARWDGGMSSDHEHEMAAGREALVRLIQRDPSVPRAIVSGPLRLMREAEEMFERWDQLKVRQRDDAMQVSMGAAMLALLLARSVRTKNVNELMIDGVGAELVRPLREARPWLQISRSRVKNRRPIEGEIPERQWRVLQFWLETGRVNWCAKHEVDAKKNVYFLPGPKGVLSRQRLNQIWNRTMRRIGVPGFTPHMMRHVTATLWLAAHPGDYATVAAWLGDSVRTVEKFYARGEGAAAMTLFAEVLESVDPTLGAYLRRY